jgi:septal ring factor EnvC (AmiA/AmiB activator)
MTTRTLPPPSKALDLLHTSLNNDRAYRMDMLAALQRERTALRNALTAAYASIESLDATVAAQREQLDGHDGAQRARRSSTGSVRALEMASLRKDLENARLENKRLTAQLAAAEGAEKAPTRKRKIEEEANGN